MILIFLKKLIKFYYFKTRYPQASIGFGSNIDKKSTIGNNVVIGNNSSIFNSHIQDHVIISSSCGIYASQIADYVRAYSRTNLYHVSIGRFSYIASDTSLSQVTIGNFCSIGPECILGYGNHPTDFVSTSPVFFSTLKQCGISFADQDSFQERKKIEIGHDVWLGARVFVKDGIKIGHGAILGAGAIVVKDVPNYAIVGGVPAKLIRFRFPSEIIHKLLEIKWWDWSEYDLRQAQHLFIQNDINAFLEWSRKQDKKNHL